MEALVVIVHSTVLLLMVEVVAHQRILILQAVMVDLAVVAGMEALAAVTVVLELLDKDLLVVVVVLASAEITNTKAVVVVALAEQDKVVHHLVHTGSVAMAAQD
jgi:hypothetical protein